MHFFHHYSRKLRPAIIAVRIDFYLEGIESFLSQYMNFELIRGINTFRMHSKYRKPEIILDAIL